MIERSPSNGSAESVIQLLIDLLEQRLDTHPCVRVLEAPHVELRTLLLKDYLLIPERFRFFSCFMMCQILLS